MTNVYLNSPNAVALPWGSFLASAPDNAITDWLQEHNGARVDAYAYESDDPLDHFHFYALTDGDNTQYINQMWNPNDIIHWADCVLESSGELPVWLFVFRDHKDAVLFKLTFSGVA